MSDEEYEYEEATPEQKLHISNYFVQSCPVGEVDELVSEVKTLVNDPAVLTDDKVAGMMHDYNVSNMVFAKAPNGNLVLVSQHGEVDANSYVDPASGKVFAFDHVAAAFTGETDFKADLGDAVAEYRVALEKQIAEYLSLNYVDNKVASAVYGSDDGTLTVCLSAKNSKLSSFWTGTWKSVFQVNVSAQGSAQLTGTIKVNVHYYEDGNVQLNTDITRESTVKVSDAAATAKAIERAIGDIEHQFQENLGEIYIQMHSTTFKSMRRFLPVSGVKMNWNTAAHSLAAEVTK
eukprot:NODE_1996_length_1164_cov_68.868852_g1979_i0.p2 GENE.NODE_1996_length_1164_cov_68.868852_g1979_i0~~NODE_1996_length_1164_cov_68.868852_g1979_i0.p2  ORF type:complete len:322 (+),score=135.37 NODE_1996_length_1164_cov_68.868852_g1979_i0:97-966(+)